MARKKARRSNIDDLPPTEATHGGKREDYEPIYAVCKGFHTAAGTRYRAGDTVAASALTPREVKILEKAAAIEVN